MSKHTMREFDALCLTPVRPLTPEQICDLRMREGASQAVFARYLNVTIGQVSQWERGEKHPQGGSLKLLALVAKNGLNGIAYTKSRYHGFTDRIASLRAQRSNPQQCSVLMGWTAPERHRCARMRLSNISSEEAVRGPD